MVASWLKSIDLDVLEHFLTYYVVTSYVGATGCLFFIGREFIMIELTVSLNWIILGLPWDVHMPLRNLDKREYA